MNVSRNLHILIYFCITLLACITAYGNSDTQVMSGFSVRIVERSDYNDYYVLNYKPLSIDPKIWVYSRSGIVFRLPDGSEFGRSVEMVVVLLENWNDKVLFYSVDLLNKAIFENFEIRNSKLIFDLIDWSSSTATVSHYSVKIEIEEGSLRLGNFEKLHSRCSF